MELRYPIDRTIERNRTLCDCGHERFCHDETGYCWVEIPSAGLSFTCPCKDFRALVPAGS